MNHEYFNVCHAADSEVKVIDLTLLKRAAFTKNTEICQWETADVNGNNMPDLSVSLCGWTICTQMKKRISCANFSRYAETGISAMINGGVHGWKYSPVQNLPESR